MSLSTSLSTALTGLTAVQSALQITSNNIANANTEGYTRKSVTPLPILIAGQGVGVDLSDINRKVNDVLVRELRNQTSDLGRLGVDDEFYVRMQDLFGSLSSGTSLTARITELSGAFEAYATAPEDAGRAAATVQAAQTLARQFNTMALEIQKMRTDADQGITAAIDTVNLRVGEIAELNMQIARDLAAGLPIANLEDERDKAIGAVAEYLEFSTFSRATGEVVLVTEGGRVLVDSRVPTFTHTASAGLDVSVTYPGPIDGIDLDGIDITAEITNGKIGAMITMRDTTLPNLAAEIDVLANTVFDQINAIHNDGAAFPPPNTLTGTRAVVGGDAFAGTGTTRIAITDANGDLVAPPVELDLSAYATVGALVTAINTALGADGTAAIVNGRLEIDAAISTSGVVINENDTAIGTQGFSHYFGLNDFFVGDATVNLASNIAVRADIVGTPELISHTELSATAAILGDTAITDGGITVAQRLADSFNNTISFAATGELGATNVKVADYASQILSFNATQAAEAESQIAFKQVLHADIKFRAESFSGVNIDEEMANLITLQNSFSAVARVISVTQEMMDTLNQIAA
ncbi:MAG TPA: flagellar hook-associated protein FlgK [Alphaproteobacteria bacterium]|nr:flagellar hook-associated protein FlgK [Alphaproteobacteria bacterium]